MAPTKQDTKGFKDIVDVWQNHLNPKLLVIVERVGEFVLDHKVVSWSSF